MHSRALEQNLNLVHFHRRQRESFGWRIPQTPYELHIYRMKLKFGFSNRSPREFPAYLFVFEGEICININISVDLKLHHLTNCTEKWTRTLDCPPRQIGLWVELQTTKCRTKSSRTLVRAEEYGTFQKRNSTSSFRLMQIGGLTLSGGDTQIFAEFHFTFPLKPNIAREEQVDNANGAGAGGREGAAMAKARRPWKRS